MSKISFTVTRELIRFDKGGEDMISIKQKYEVPTLTIHGDVEKSYRKFPQANHCWTLPFRQLLRLRRFQGLSLPTQCLNSAALLLYRYSHAFLLSRMISGIDGSKFPIGNLEW